MNAPAWSRSFELDLALAPKATSCAMDSEALCIVTLTAPAEQNEPGHNHMTHANPSVLLPNAAAPLKAHIRETELRRRPAWYPARAGYSHLFAARPQPGLQQPTGKITAGSRLSCQRLVVRYRCVSPNV